MLEPILKKPLSSAPHRLQSMMIRLQKDNIDARSECGAKMYQKLKEIQRETEADQTLQVVKPLILKGWPDDKIDLPLQAAPYHGLRDELTV